MMEMDRHSHFSKTSLMTNEKVYYFFQKNSPRYSESSFLTLTILTQSCPQPSISYAEEDTTKKNKPYLYIPTRH